MSSITETMVRKWAGKFLDKNEFYPSAKMASEHFDIPKDEAERILKVIYGPKRGKERIQRALSA